MDRNGSVLSIVSLSLPGGWRRGVGLDKLADFLAERLRITDTPGWRHDGRLGVLLPDTPRSGAEHVASEILDFLGESYDSLPVEIAVYPDEHESVDRSVERESAPVNAPAHVGVAAGASLASSTALYVMPLPFWKRAMDVACATACLTIAGPALVVFATAVAATSPGGAFFLQEREGLGGRRFKIIKLRTMVAGADSIKDRLRKHSVQDGPAFKMYSDPRVTAVGRFLRATSLDELPQFINVLKGDMTLVGPRPLPVDESAACEPWQRRRLSVTPGITCTWQVSARNLVSFDEWMRMDLQYARQRSLARDLKLLLWTPASILLTRGPR